MTSLTKTAAVSLALALAGGASSVSAQTHGFSHAGELITARGALVQYLNMPGIVEKTCVIEAYGVVAEDGQSMLIEDYDGLQAVGDPGNLACSDSVDFPIIVTASSASEINLDELIVGTRGGPCQALSYRLPYTSNVVTFPGEGFGIADFCRASGNLTVTTDTTGAPVNIIANP